MDFIQQAFKGKFATWKYIIPCLGFFGLMALNYAVIKYLDLDVDEMMKEQIESSGANNVLFQNLIIFLIFLIGLFLWVKFVHKQSITSLTTARHKIDWKRIFFSFTLWGFITVAMTFYAYHSTPEDFVWNFNFDKFIVLAIIAILLVPFQTSFEEYFFRGYLMQGLGVLAKNKWLPLIVTSVVFGLMHGANPEVDKLGPIIMVYYIGTGLFLGIMTLMDDGLELALGFHAANNLITALLVTADWTAFQTDSILVDVSEPSAGFDVLVPVFVIFPILLFIFAKKYKWSNWKDRLFGQVEDITVDELSEIGNVK
ncbi:CPBP family intramembrane glutamic endopeptidase [Urechidicola croceus]|uniref:CAAX protease family protein n=1 Tax=Urechidicola croceus TaxID=1850246 RepID=A0A1D8P6M9_9FLAO|nr:CPBP family intramembrane glutamic endopeptidase [Urechidicola croceus]AOW20235.1 CAAX protease family protein [Urechidicola croceus]